MSASQPAVRIDIRVLVADDHPGVLAGLEGLLRGELDLACVGALAGIGRLHDVVRDTRPDVVVLDYARGDAGGLAACFRLKQRPNAPAVVLYSAYVAPVFAVPAAIAQADATVAKSAPAEDVLRSIRSVVGDEPRRVQLDPESIEAVSARLQPDDRPIVGLLLCATPMVDVAQILDVSLAEVHSRALRILGCLRAAHHARPSTPLRAVVSRGISRHRAWAPVTARHELPRPVERPPRLRAAGRDPHAPRPVSESCTRSNRQSRRWVPVDCEMRASTRGLNRDKQRGSDQDPMRRPDFSCHYVFLAMRGRAR